jgi:hypothetical protein
MRLAERFQAKAHWAIADPPAMDCLGADHAAALG